MQLKLAPDEEHGTNGEVSAGRRRRGTRSSEMAEV
jgi:hypothetical protein